MPLIDPTPLIAKAPVIPVLTIDRAADAAPLARALAAGGLPVIEVTLRTRAALDAVHARGGARRGTGAGGAGLRHRERGDGADGARLHRAQVLPRRTIGRRRLA